MINKNSIIWKADSTVLNGLTWMKASLLVAVFLFSYFQGISLLVKAWANDSTYSHGFLVPFISLYFVWCKREKLKELIGQPNIFAGLLVMVIGCLMHFIGDISSVVLFQQLSIIVLSNDGSSNPTTIAFKVADIMLEKIFDTPSPYNKQSFLPLNEENLKKLLGSNLLPLVYKDLCASTMSGYATASVRICKVGTFTQNLKLEIVQSKECFYLICIIAMFQGAL